MHTSSGFDIDLAIWYVAKGLQLDSGYSHIHADTYVRPQLGFDAGHHREHAQRSQLAALPAKIGALENVAEFIRSPQHIQAARKPCLSIRLDQHFLRFVYREADVQPLLEGLA
jgi:hypothetical protein